MINQSEKNKIETNVENSNRFAVAMNSNIFNILSSKIYERPIEAIVREVFSNAIDANIEAGKKDGLYVHLPTEEELYFSVKDTGVGMDNDKLQQVFFEYGNSTKQGTNDQIGGFGIGAKTPFAYTDQFTIESAKNGVKTTYIAMKDEDDCPSHSEPIFEDCGDETGTTVTVPVERSDIGQFVGAAVKVFLFSKEMPELNEDAVPRFLQMYNILAKTADKCQTLDDFLAIREHNKTANYMRGLALNGTFLEMGGVLYSIDEGVIDREISMMNKGVENILIHLNVGEVSPQASREKLNYTKATIRRVKDAVIEMLQSIIDDVARYVERKDVTFAQKIAYIDKYNEFSSYSTYIERLQADTDR